MEWLSLLEISAPLPTWQKAGLGGIVGAIIGSFLGAVVVRLPQRRGIAMERSACDSCHRLLTAPDLVPIVSFIALRGRCRTCGAPIDRVQFLSEVLGGLVGAIPWGLGLSALPAFAAMVMGWQLILLALLDFRHFWLPLRLVLILGVTGLLFTALGNIAGIVLSEALAGGALAFALLWLVRTGYRITRGREGMGGGDAPLFGAIGIWVGPTGVVFVLLGASLSGLGVVGALLLGGRRIAADMPLPLGTLLALAAWPVFLMLTMM